MNKITVGITIAVIALVVIIWIARPDSQTNNTTSISPNSAGSLSAEEKSFDFGAISMASGKVRRSFKIKNTGVEPVVIEKIYTSCMCTAALLMMNGREFGPYGMPGHGFIPGINEKMESGGEAIIEVIFDPAAHGPAGVGPIQRIVIIENDTGQPLELGFSAFVTP